MSDAEDGEEIEAPPAPLKIQDAVLDTQYNLPIKAEKFSIGLSACPGEGSFVDVDLACALFSTAGSLIDVAYHSSPSALGGSVRHCGSNPVGASNADEDSEIVHVLPALVPTSCCLMVFTAGGFNIQDSSTLSMTVHAKERKKIKEPVVRCDLLQILNGCNARVALTVYRSGNGWLAYYPSTGAPPDPSTTYWGSLVPHMKMIAATIPSLEYAAAFKPDESELYESQEKQLDESIGSAATRNALLPAPKRPEATLWPAVPDETCEQKPTPSRLRIDVGWNLWQEEGEGTDLQYQLVFTTATGEGVECGEDQGVVQGIQGPPEEEEEEAEPEEGEEAPPEKEEHPAPKGQDVDPHGFPVKDSFYINMASLPAKVKNIVVQINNFGGSGMRDVKTLCTRVVDATEEDPNAHRDLFVLKMPSGKGEHGNRSIATLAKIYKEYFDSPFAMLREGAAKPLAEYIDDEEKVRETLTAVRDGYCAELETENQLNAALEAEENGEEDVAKPTLKSFDWRVSAVKVLDVAEDAATYAEVECKRSAAFEGQYNALGQRHGDLVRAVYENNDCYLGTYADDLRAGKGMYIHANKAAFAGSFQAGQRAGKGVMLLPDGGVYTGEFAADKWEGNGKYEYPDGSCYVGEWKEGKKHGSGTYWDKHGGCLVGTWDKGIMTGPANYRHPAYSMQGTFTKGIPDGQFTFETIAFRKLADPTLPESTAAHIRSSQGPSLTHLGSYAIPDGAAKDPEIDEDGNEVEPDADAPKMPAFPNYTGLSYTAGSGNPEPGSNTVYPPVDVDVPVCVIPASFNVAQGLQVAAK